MAYRDRVKFTTLTAGTGAVTVNTASSGFRLPAAAGIVNGDDVRYAIEDGTAWETGYAIASATATVFSRQLEASSTGALLSLTGNAVMYFTPTASLFNTISTRGLMLQTAVANYSM